MAEQHDHLQDARAALAAIERLAGVSGDPAGASESVEPRRILDVQRELTRAVAALTDELTALRAAFDATTVPPTLTGGEGARNSARVEPEMPAGGPGYDRGRPRRGYRPGE